MNRSSVQPLNLKKNKKKKGKWKKTDTSYPLPAAELTDESDEGNELDGRVADASARNLMSHSKLRLMRGRMRCRISGLTYRA